MFRSEDEILSRRRPGAKATQASRAIQLPPLSSPRPGPPHVWSDARHRHRVWHVGLKRRIPSASHARRRILAWAYPQVSSGSSVAIGQLSTDSIRTRQHKLTGLQACLAGRPVKDQPHKDTFEPRRNQGRQRVRHIIAGPEVGVPATRKHRTVDVETCPGNHIESGTCLQA